MGPGRGPAALWDASIRHRGGWTCAGGLGKGGRDEVGARFGRPPSGTLLRARFPAPARAIEFRVCGGCGILGLETLRIMIRRTGTVAPRPPEQAMAIRNSLAITRHRRIVICVVFLSPSRRLRRPRSHLSQVPPTYRRFPCDRAKHIRDNIRHRRVGPIPTTSVKSYASYSYGDVGPSSIADGPTYRSALGQAAWRSL